jgi:hypothetical protein
MCRVLDRDHHAGWSSWTLNPFNPKNLLDLDGDHLDSRLGIVILVRGHLLNGVYDIHALDDLAKHGVLRLCALVKPVEEGIVDRVDEELGAARLGTGVCHREGSGLVGDLGRVLVGD